jgi:hypothetical protein
MTCSSDTRYFDIKQFSTTSGLSVATIRRLARDGRIPYLQPAGKGGKLLFPPDALELADQGATHASAQPRPTTSRQSSHLRGPVPSWMQDNLSEN